eukprot:scaffold159588_cov26-Tisochrysis_lutea.AAC.5
MSASISSIDDSDSSPVATSAGWAPSRSGMARRRKTTSDVGSDAMGGAKAAEARAAAARDPTKISRSSSKSRRTG